MMTLRSKIRRLLLGAAVGQRVVFYDQLFSLAPRVPKSELFTELEEASASIAGLSEVIYSALMARRDTGLPGDGFYDLVRIQRNALWRSITKGREPHVLELTLDEKRVMVHEERRRVYADVLLRRIT
jgi:hypothetical protein